MAPKCPKRWPSHILRLCQIIFCTSNSAAVFFQTSCLSLSILDRRDRAQACSFLLESATRVSSLFAASAPVELLAMPAAVRTALIGSTSSSAQASVPPSAPSVQRQQVTNIRANQELAARPKMAAITRNLREFQPLRQHLQRSVAVLLLDGCIFSIFHV